MSRRGTKAKGERPQRATASLHSWCISVVRIEMSYEKTTGLKIPLPLALLNQNYLPSLWLELRTLRLWNWRAAYCAKKALSFGFCVKLLILIFSHFCTFEVRLFSPPPSTQQKSKRGVPRPLRRRPPTAAMQPIKTVNQLKHWNLVCFCASKAVRESELFKRTEAETAEATTKIVP